MLIVSELIQAARDLDPAFDARRHSPTAAVRFLNRRHKRLVGEWIKHEPDAFQESVTITFPLDDFAAGHFLFLSESESTRGLRATAIYSPLDMWVRGEQEPRPLALSPWRDRHRVAGRACWLVESTLHFAGVAADWNDVLRVVLSYVPTPIELTALDEELDLPDTTEDVLVTAIAAFFARRTNDKELARPRREYITDELDAEALWIDELRFRRGATSSRTTEVW